PMQGRGGVLVARRAGGGGGGGRDPPAGGGAPPAARPRHTPVLLDGFVATSAVVPLVRLNPAVLDHCRAAHVSAEAAHRALLRRLRMRPLLDLDMRLGEASGAAVAILLLRAALSCHAGMATFVEAGVSGPDGSSTRGRGRPE